MPKLDFKNVVQKNLPNIKVIDNKEENNNIGEDDKLNQKYKSQIDIYKN